MTLVHGDLRGDNLLFDESSGHDEVWIIDWQLVNKTLATYDVARLLGGSEPVAERKDHQLEILWAWHDSLKRAGVTGYSRDEALHDFRLAVLLCLSIPVNLMKRKGRDPEGRMARLLDAVSTRFFAAAIELEAAAALSG